MFNQMYPPPTTLATGQQPRPSNNSTANPTASAANPSRPTATGPNSANPNRPPPSNASTTGAPASAAGQPSAGQQQPFVPAPAPYMPYMDPFYYSMLASFGYPMAPYANPYGPMMPPYGPMYPQRPLNDDQQSVHSYHYENLDTRSENRFGMPPGQHRAQSVAGGSFDHQGRQNTGLLTQFNQPQAPTTSADQDTLNTVDANMSTLANIKKESESQHRMTPLMHQRPHVRANFSLNGLVQIRANDPCEGQPALVDIINLSDLMEQYLNNLKKSFANEDKSLQVKERTAGDEMDDDNNQNADNEEDFSLQAEISKEILANYKLLQEFPGPLVKEHTSKAQIVQFCQKVVKDCLSSTTINLIDPQSHALLWDYLALLVRQNGIIDLKTDISQLLLSGIVDNQQQWSLTFSTTTTTTTSTTTTISATPVPAQDFVMVNGDSTIDTIGANDRRQAPNSQRQLQTPQPTDEELHLNKLREFLGAGQRQDAIELAMKHNMWPHALFLASSTSFNINQATSGSQMAAIGGPLNPSPSVPNMMSVTSMAESKTLQKVKARFINSLQPNDPINTCYQLLIGRVPPVANVI